jgi:hypothetical protein
MGSNVSVITPTYSFLVSGVVYRDRLSRTFQWDVVDGGSVGDTKVVISGLTIHESIV